MNVLLTLVRYSSLHNDMVEFTNCLFSTDKTKVERAALLLYIRCDKLKSASALKYMAGTEQWEIAAKNRCSLFRTTQENIPAKCYQALLTSIDFGRDIREFANILVAHASDELRKSIALRFLNKDEYNGDDLESGTNQEITRVNLSDTECNDDEDDTSTPYDPEQAAGDDALSLTPGDDGIIKVLNTGPHSTFWNVIITLLAACSNGEEKKKAFQQVLSRDENEVSEGFNALLKLADRKTAAAALRHMGMPDRSSDCDSSQNDSNFESSDDEATENTLLNSFCDNKACDKDIDVSTISGNITDNMQSEDTLSQTGDVPVEFSDSDSDASKVLDPSSTVPEIKIRSTSSQSDVISSDDSLTRDVISSDDSLTRLTSGTKRKLEDLSITDDHEEGLGMVYNSHYTEVLQLREEIKTAFHERPLNFTKIDDVVTLVNTCQPGKEKEEIKVLLLSENENEMERGCQMLWTLCHKSEAYNNSKDVTEDDNVAIELSKSSICNANEDESMSLAGDSDLSYDNAELKSSEVDQYDNCSNYSQDTCDRPGLSDHRNEVVDDLLCDDSNETATVTPECVVNTSLLTNSQSNHAGINGFAALLKACAPGEEKETARKVLLSEDEHEMIEGCRILRRICDKSKISDVLNLLSEACKISTPSDFQSNNDNSVILSGDLNVYMGCNAEGGRIRYFKQHEHDNILSDNNMNNKASQIPELRTVDCHIQTESHEACDNTVLYNNNNNNNNNLPTGIVCSPLSKLPVQSASMCSSKDPVSTQNASRWPINSSTLAQLLRGRSNVSNTFDYRIAFGGLPADKFEESTTLIDTLKIKKGFVHLVLSGLLKLNQLV